MHTPEMLRRSNIPKPPPDSIDMRNVSKDEYAILCQLAECRKSIQLRLEVIQHLEDNLRYLLRKQEERDAQDPHNAMPFLDDQDMWDAFHNGLA